MAQRCIRLFDADPTSAGALHQQSQRFLAPTFRGQDSAGDIPDVGLRPLVVALGSGQTLPHMLLDSDDAMARYFVRWISAFRLVRVAERSVEGRHSRIHRIRERAPSASLAYLSSECRFGSMRALAATSPKAISC